MDYFREISIFLERNKGNYLDDSHIPQLKGNRIFDDPLFKVGSADDPLFATLKNPEVCCEETLLPNEWLPGAKSVISIFLPFTEEVKRSNYPGRYPSPLWSSSFILGKRIMLEMANRFVEMLKEAGFDAVCPANNPDFRRIGPFASNWSERHVGFVCGLGTFGISKALITEKGCAGRIVSIITTAELPITKREYADTYEWCTGCGACARRCPTKAIKYGIDKGKCKDTSLCAKGLPETVREYEFDIGVIKTDACGKCQTDVPCMSHRP